MSDSWRTCHACSRQVEMNPGQALGDALSGWVIVSSMRDRDSFDRFSFCSMCCLHHWVQQQVPVIPEVFLHSIDDSPYSP